MLPAILGVYESQGIKNGAPTNKQKGPAFKTELATAYPECRLVVTKETMTIKTIIGGALITIGTFVLIF